jgi:hypothetical protein
LFELDIILLSISILGEISSLGLIYVSTINPSINSDPIRNLCSKTEEDYLIGDFDLDLYATITPVEDLAVDCWLGVTIPLLGHFS